MVTDINIIHLTCKTSSRLQYLRAYIWYALRCSCYEYFLEIFTFKNDMPSGKTFILKKLACKAVFRMLKYRQSDSTYLLIICSSADIWEFEYSHTIEVLHANFCKRFWCFNQSGSKCIAINEYVRLSLYVFNMSQCHKYWAKHTKMPIYRYSKLWHFMTIQEEWHGWDKPLLENL